MTTTMEWVAMRFIDTSDYITKDLEFIGNFNNNRVNSPTWVFQHHIDANDVGMGTLYTVRFTDSATISLGVRNLYHELPVMPHRVFVVKNPFHEEERHIPFPPHFNAQSLIRPFHIHITLVFDHEANKFQIVHVKHTDAYIPRYAIYNSQTQLWDSKLAVEAERHADEGDQSRLMTVLGFGMPRFTIFFRDGQETPFYKRVGRVGPMKPVKSLDECSDVAMLFSGPWVLMYGMFSTGEGSWLVDLEFVVIQRRHQNRDKLDRVTSLPRRLFMELPTSVRAVSFREIDGFLYVDFQTREIVHANT